MYVATLSIKVVLDGLYLEYMKKWNEISVYLAKTLHIYNQGDVSDRK